MILEIQNRSGLAVPRKYLVDFFVRVEGALKPRLNQKWRRQLQEGHLLIVFVATAEAKALNRRFRHRNYATDVLSFEPMEPGSLGELVMSPAVLKRQCKDTGLSFREEVAYMGLHGLLHLLGFDHEGVSEQKAKRMFGLQDQIFTQIRS